MSRFAFAMLLAALTALAASHLDAPTAGAQDKKKDKKKDKTDPPESGEKDDLARVLPVFDSGAHTQPISALGFTADKSKLITVGQDFTIQVWSVATGERLDILRLPGYGREKGYDPARWDVAAVSPDGTRVAIGGHPKFLVETSGTPNHVSRLLLVDLPKRRVHEVGLGGTNANGHVEALTFSPDGERLAVALNRQGGDRLHLRVVGGLTDRIAKATGAIDTKDRSDVKTTLADGPTSLAFSPDGKKLLVGSSDRHVSLWDVPDGVAPMPTVAKDVTAEGDTHGLAWSPDGTRFARTSDGGQNSGLRAVELWAADGTREKVWKADDLNRLFPARSGKLYTVKFLDAKTLFVAAAGPVEKGDGGGTIAGTIDVATGRDERFVGISEGMLKTSIGTTSADGLLTAVAVTGNTEVVIGKPGAGDRVRCGGQTQLPYQVGWSKDAARPGFAWADERAGKAEPTSATLTFGFDLAKVEPIGAIKGADYVPSTRKLGEWTLTFPGKKDEDEGKGLAHLRRNGQFVRGFAGAKGIGHTLVANGDKPPLVAFANHIDEKGDVGMIRDADGLLVARLLPMATRMHSLTASPDGRFLIATTGTPRLVVYRTHGSPYPLLSFAQLNGEWVVWTPEGYYAASPGGEKLFGWAVSNGPNVLTTFHPAEKFAKHYRRPDVIKLTIEKGSVKDALAALKAPVAPDVEKILPPIAKLELVEQRGAVIKVKASAQAEAQGKPVQAMRVLLDGRPLPGGAGVWVPEPSNPAVGVYEVSVPPGAHELKVLARNEDGAAVSDPLPVRGPKDPTKQPTLHRVCVGVDAYDDPGLKLVAAANDAKALFAALAADCVGPDNRFAAAKGELILDKDATRDRVLAALKAVQKAARPGDLVVFTFAGHGVSQTEADGKSDNYYLLTREADISKPLKGKSLSGDDLRTELAAMECPVLVVLDSCHSSGSTPKLKEFRPAVDYATRTLTHENVGATILSAAMSYEVATATSEHGHFTAGLLKGLKAGVGVPFDPYERQLYVHHLYSVAFSEVRRATGGKQNPFLNMPWTVPPLPIREVPGK